MTLEQSQEQGKAIDSSITTNLSGTGEDKSTAKKPEENKAIESELKSEVQLEETKETNPGREPSLLAKQLVKLFRQSKSIEQEEEKAPEAGIKVQGIFATLDDIAEELKGIKPSPEDAEKVKIAEAAKTAEALKAKEADIGHDPTKKNS